MKTFKYWALALLAVVAIAGCTKAPPHAVVYGARYQQSADALTTSNQATTSGLAQTIDGFAANAPGLRIWLVGQTTFSQDGCYLVASGTWPRCDDVPVGYDAAGDRFTVKNGSVNSGPWTITNPPGSGLVGVNDLTASAGGGSGSGSVLAIDALCPSNVGSLSGLATVCDGVTLSTDSMAALAVAQTTTTQDGLWQVHSGAWTLSGLMPLGSTAAGKYFVNSKGTSDHGTWVISGVNAGSVVGTDDLQATRVTDLATIGNAVNFTSVATGAGGTVLIGLQTDLGITLNSGKVSAWADQSGNSRNFAQVSAPAQPAYGTFTFSGFSAITCDGSATFLDESTYSLPAPGTTTTTIYAILRQESWVASKFITGVHTGTGPSIATQTTTPDLVSYAGTAVSTLNNGAAVGSLVRVMAKFTNSTSDTFKAGSVSVTGVNTGNSVGTGLQICNTAGGTAVPNTSILVLMYLQGDATGAVATALDAAATQKYGAVGE